MVNFRRWWDEIVRDPQIAICRFASPDSTPSMPEIAFSSPFDASCNISSATAVLCTALAVGLCLCVTEFLQSPHLRHRAPASSHKIGFSLRYVVDHFVMCSVTQMRRLQKLGNAEAETDSERDAEDGSGGADVAGGGGRRRESDLGHQWCGIG
ncbi:hypothetical protein ACLOJK_013943 [Asimina triloba]